MAQSQNLHQTQTESQIQKLSPQQLMVVKLVELPLADLEERVKNEVIDNVALEEGPDRAHEMDTTEGSDMSEDDYSEGHIDDANGDIGDYASPDDIPSYIVNRREAEGVEIPIGDTKSFIDDLLNQMSEYDITEHQRDLIEYLIGSLNQNGFIDRPIDSIVDELVIYHNIETDEKELEDALHILQEFDPPGIGARDLRECLLIQIQRELNDTDSSKNSEKYSLLELEYKIISDYYNLFVNKNTDKLLSVLEVDSETLRKAFESIGKLNPHPGSALCEASDDRVQTVIPDFIVETDGDGGINLTLNDGDVPELHVSREYVDQLSEYQKNQKNMKRDEKEAFLYTKQKVDAARMFIDSIKQRRHTLYVTMKAIIELQHDFFITQDDDVLKPMILRDVADKAHLDISTVSRVRNSKYVMIDGNVYSLKHFFERTRTNSEGEELSARKVVQAIKALIDAEDKSNPYSDEKIVSLLTDMGVNIKRRTVAKYRDEIGYPIAKLRKKF